MGNEMGNNNVTGLQEQNDTKLDAPKRSSEASIDSVNVDDDEPEKHKVHSPKEKDFHVKDVSWNSNDPLGIRDPKEASDMKDDSETQPPNGCSEDPLATNDTDDGETQSILFSKDDETDDFKILASKDSSAVLSGKIDTHDEVNQSIPSNKKDGTYSSETQAPSGSSEVALTKTDTNVEENESVPWETNDTNVKETEFIPTSKGAETDDCNIQVPLVIDDANVEETEFNPSSGDGETDGCEIHVPYGLPSVPFRNNDTDVEEIQYVPTSKGNSTRKTDKEIERQPSTEREQSNMQVQVPYESLKVSLLSNDSNLELQSVLSNEIVSSPGKDPTERSFDQTQIQSSRTDSGNAASEESEGSLKAQLDPSDVSDEKPSFVACSKDKSFDEEASASEKNPSETCDGQLQNQSMVCGEGTQEQMMNSSLDTESTGQDPEPMECVGMKSECQELVKIHLEPHLEIGSSSLQRSDSVSKSEPHDSGKEGKKLEHEIDEKFEETVIQSSSLVEQGEQEEQNKEKEAQEEKLPVISNVYETNLENQGRTEVGMTDITVVMKDEVEELTLFYKSYSEPQLEEAQSAKSPLLREKVSECIEKLQVQDEDADLIKNESETEENKQNLYLFSVSEGSDEESQVHMTGTAATDLMMTVTTNSDATIEKTEVHGFCNSEIKIDFKVDAENENESGCQVNNFFDSNINLACQEDGLGFEKITETIVEASSSPQCFLPLCNFKEIIAAKPGDSNKEVLKGGKQSGILEQILMQSDPIEQEEVSVSNCPVPVENSQDVSREMSLLAPDLEDSERSSNIEPNQENSCHNEVKVIEDTSNSTYSTGEHDSHTDFPTAESNKNPNTGLKQEDLRDEASFDLGILIAKNDESTQQTDSDIQDSEHKSTPKQQETDAEYGSFWTVSCDLEAKQTADRSSTELNSEKLESHAKGTETSSKTRIEDSDKSPLLSKEETVDRDVFELKGCDNETFQSKLEEVHDGNAVADTTYKTLNLSKEERGQETSPDQEFSAEKQATEMERSDSEKLKIPLLSFVKEKSTIIKGFQQKQENFGKEEVEDKRFTVATEIKDASPQSGREKRKIKSSFFSNCLCCTAVIQ